MLSRNNFSSQGLTEEKSALFFLHSLEVELNCQLALWLASATQNLRVIREGIHSLMLELVYLSQ